MKKKIALLLIAIPLVSWGQGKELDSLRKALERHPQEDTLRFKLLINVSEYLLTGPLESKVHIEQALALANELGFKEGIAEAYAALANYYWNNLDHAKAVEQGLMALRKYEEINNVHGLYTTYDMMAGIYVSWKDFDKARMYMDKVVALGESNKGLVDFAHLYYNMAFMEIRQNKFEEGMDLAKRALTLNLESNDFYQQANCYFLLAKAKQGLGKTNAALEDFQNCIRVNKKSDHPNTPSNTASAHEGMGNCYIKLKEFNKAFLHLDTAFRAAKQINSKFTIMRIYTDRALLYEAQGNYKEALKFERINKGLSDSVLNTEKATQLADAQTKYETEQKQQTINLLKQDNKIKLLTRNLLLAGLAFVMAVAALIYYFQRQKNRKEHQLLVAQESLNTKLVEVDKLKSRLFANISHEFRTPLTLILSPVEEKLAAGHLAQNDKITFQSIKRGANRLLELINQVLELSKLESGFMKMNRQPGNLYSFIMPVLSAFDSMADVGQVQYTKEIRIPEYPLLFDGDKLEKILTNLLSNAFKFTPKTGRVDVKLLTTEKEKSIDLSIIIKNTGSAISPSTLDKIFEPFFQGDSAPAQGIPGTGLGLSLVKELINLHGGDISVVSNAEEGTVFTVNIMFEKSDEPAAVQATIKNESDGLLEAVSDNFQSETDATKETILIVEDNLDVRNLVRHGLEEQYNILEAATGKDGVEMARENSIDLVVSDVMMPVMSGVELCHLLKNDERTSHLPIILLTARADHESKLEGLRTGADDYVVKPFNMQELQARISNLIAQRKKLIEKYNERMVVHPHEITVTPLDERFMQKAIRVVEDNLDNVALSVDKMSETMGMSRTNLHRKLKAITGLATSEFIQDFRLRRAAHLIENKTDNISQIAYQVGFNDQSYFTKCFKKKFGKVPSEYASMH